MDVKLILPFYRRSKFAGIRDQQQAPKIRASRHGFTGKRIAAARCFDRDALCAINAETPIRAVSDGITMGGFHWMREQSRKLRHKRTGVWTALVRPGTMLDQSFVEFERQLPERFGERVTSSDRMEVWNNGKSIAKCLYDVLFWTPHRVKPYMVKAKEVLRA